MSDWRPVTDLITLYKEGEYDTALHGELTTAAIDAVRHRPGLCPPVDPTDVRVGDAVTFRYGRPDVNDPWRFGIVTEFRAGSWVIFTFNIRRRREGPKGKIVKCGPEFRSYALPEMKEVRTVPTWMTADRDLTKDMDQVGAATVRFLGNLLKPKGGDDEVRHPNGA